VELLESRRLTGPNLAWDHPGAVMQVSFDKGVGAVEAWQTHAVAILEAVGWSDQHVVARTFSGGADLVMSAPIDALYAACELNEWAWEAACATVAGETPPALAEAAQRLAALIDEERNPRLLALRDAAQDHDVCFLSDDDLASVGMGVGSQVWPVGDLPTPDAIDWSKVHDVPTLFVTGTNGKSTTVRLLASIVEAAGRRPGVCTTDGIRVGDRTLDTGDWTGPGAARQVVRHPKTEVAILEVARGGLLRRGLGVPRANAAAVLNVAEDHFGEFGVDEMETLIATKFLVQRAVVPKGRMVLNADDARLLARGKTIEGPVTWFGDNVPADATSACVVVDGVLTLVEHGESHEVAPVAAVPVTMGGAARYNVSNVLAAIALASAIEIPLPAIARGLRDFDNSPETNPGRGNVFEFGGITAVVDYAHNPHGMAAFLEMASAMPAERRLVTLGQAGDRTDDAIADLALAVWATKPDRIILKEMVRYERGRPAAEVIEIMERALREAGMPADRIGHADSETQAVEQALAWARAGDLLLFAIQSDRAEVLERLTALRAADRR